MTEPAPTRSRPGFNETRGLPVEHVAALVKQFFELPQLGLLGEALANALRLNLALDNAQR